jgi:ketosteroid isomerase-like protein
MSDLKQLATQYFETFSNKDLDNLANMFTEDVTLRDWTKSANGKVGMLAAIKDLFDAVNTITATPVALYEEGDTVIAELVILVNDNESLLVVDVIKFQGNKISSVIAYRG